MFSMGDTIVLQASDNIAVRDEEKITNKLLLQTREANTRNKCTKGIKNPFILPIFKLFQL